MYFWMCGLFSARKSRFCFCEVCPAWPLKRCPYYLYMYTRAVWEFPEKKVPDWGLPIIRIIVFWDLYWVPVFIEITI